MIFSLAAATGDSKNWVKLILNGPGEKGGEHFQCDREKRRKIADLGG